jgi:hypothetical protein
MAMNKSGLPPMKRPIVAAERPGGFGTVEPKKPSLNLGTGMDPPKLGGALKMPKLARGGRLGPQIPKMPKIPTIKPVKF